MVGRIAIRGKIDEAHRFPPIVISRERQSRSRVWENSSQSKHAKCEKEEPPSDCRIMHSVLNPLARSTSGRTWASSHGDQSRQTTGRILPESWRFFCGAANFTRGRRRLAFRDAKRSRSCRPGSRGNRRKRPRRQRRRSSCAGRMYRARAAVQQIAVEIGIVIAAVKMVPARRRRAGRSRPKESWSLPASPLEMSSPPLPRIVSLPLPPER